MKKYFTIAFMAILFMGFAQSYSQNIDQEAVFDSLTTLDPEIKQYFPRWKVCEHDLQVQIYQTFVTMGYEKETLNMSNIVILAAPRAWDDLPFELLTISCGNSSMSTIDIEANMGQTLIGFLSGEIFYTGPLRGDRKDIAIRDYCHEDLPISIKLNPDERSAIVSYLEPSNASHAFTLSLFDQTLKIGDTGFWLKSSLGTDEVGYHFWSAGEAKITLKRPLYPNYDERTREKLPYLINAYFGGGYRLSSGINSSGTLLSWVSDRTLNTANGGKLLAGLDFHMPMHPEAGIHLNAEIPLSGMTNESINDPDYGYYSANQFVDFNPADPRYGQYRIDRIAPILRGTGQISAFYHWWLDDKNPENYFRFDAGISYAEVREVGVYKVEDSLSSVTFIEPNAMGLATWKNNEAADWLYFKVEFRNQAAFPFGVSMQYSNQIMLSRVWVPIFGNWFYIEAKYAQPLRDARPYEVENFFMISPVLRLTI